MTARVYDLKRLNHLHRYINKYVFEPNAEELEMLIEYDYLKNKYPDWKQEREINHYEKMRPKINKPKR